MAQDEMGKATAVVTGGLVGMGQAIACALSANGVRVAIGARRGDDPALKEEAQALMGPDTLVHPLDVRSEESVLAFREIVEAECGPVGILVNAAGVCIHQTVSGHTLQDWNDSIETNLTGPFLMMKSFMPAMMERGWGRIISIASTAARTAMPDQAAYCASKTGLLGLSRAAALEGAPHGVTCLTVSPTWVETQMLRDSAAIMAGRSGRDVSAEIADIARSNPQNRLVQPEEIGALVAFLCSDKVPALTMEDISVNAGAEW